MKRPRHIDQLLNQWPYDPNSLSVRLVKGADGREVVQMRVDMGLLQLETTGRPDGAQPEGYDSYLDYLKARELKDGHFLLSDEQCNEVDREFMQMYHRRICWLRLEYYRRAVIDADHTLALMDISTRLAPDEEWTATHEEYRPCVWFQRSPAQALAGLEENGAEAAARCGRRRREVRTGCQTPRRTRSSRCDVVAAHVDAKLARFAVLLAAIGHVDLAAAAALDGGAGPVDHHRRGLGLA